MSQGQSFGMPGEAAGWFLYSLPGQRVRVVIGDNVELNVDYPDKRVGRAVVCFDIPFPSGHRTYYISWQLLFNFNHSHT